MPRTPITGSQRRRPCCFADFRKAFDLGDGAILLVTKLAAIGVRKTFWKYVGAKVFIERKLTTKLPGVLSVQGRIKLVGGSGALFLVEAPDPCVKLTYHQIC